jgi:hypothetical protein
MLLLTEPSAQGPSGGPALGQHGPEGVRLDRVAQERAGAVGLDVLDPPRVQARPPVGGAEHGLLAPPARGRQPVGAPVLVDRAAPDHGIDRVAVGQGAPQRLQHDEAGPLAADVAVGPRVEGLAQAVGGEEPRPGQLRRDLGRQDQVDAAGQGQRASPPRRLWHAWWTATSDEEQAVSSARLGPRKSKAYDSRLAAMLAALPVTT